MANTPAFGYVYTDVAFRDHRRHRAQRVLGTGLWLIAVNCGAFGLVGASDGVWLLAGIEGTTAAFAAGLLLLRGHIGFHTAAHATFWVLALFLWLLILLVEGTGQPFGGVNQNWFVVLLVGSSLVLFDEAPSTRRMYVAVCAGSYAVFAFGLVRTTPVAPLPADVLPMANGLTLASQFVCLALMVRAFVRDIGEAEHQLALANGRLEELIGNMLPRSISERLRREGRTFADGFAQCSVLFADIVGFTPLAASVAPQELVRLLDEIFSRFDDLTDQLGLEKIKTIGDAYMVASGLPNERSDHADALAQLAIGVRRIVAEYPGLQVRIGINSGAVVAGIIGKKRFVYDLWGDAVNIASRMESQGVPGEIQVSEATYELLKDDYRFEPRGEITVKGRGAMRVFLLRAEAAPFAPAVTAAAVATHST